MDINEINQIVNENRLYMQREYIKDQLRLHKNSRWSRHVQTNIRNLQHQYVLLTAAEDRYLENPTEWNYNMYNINYNNMIALFSDLHRHQDIQLRFNSI